MQKKILAALLLSLVYPLKIFSQTVELPSVVITEIGAFEPSETEWIEIYNRSGTTTDLTDWKFFEDSANHGLAAFRGDFALEPEEYAVIANKADLFAQKYPAYLGTIFDSNWGNLKEEGEEIGLKDSAGNIIEIFTYPVAQNTSLEKININFQGTMPENWAPHHISHSMGQPRQIAEVAPIEPSLPPTTPPQEPLQPPPQPTTLAPTPQAPPPPSAPEPPLAPNSAPQAIIQIQSGSPTAYENTTINFDGRASFDPNGDPLTYLWDMGDGTVETGANPSSHKYNQGTYIVTLTVIDPHGAKSFAQQYIQVLNKPQISVPQSTPSSPPPEPTPQILPAPPKSTAKASTFIPEDAMLTLRGYFVFVPQEMVEKSVVKKKTKRPPKKSPKKSKKPIAKKPAVFRNGDLSREIKITEIFPNPGLDDENEEWIEIFNAGEKPVNLGNWTLSDSKKTSPYQIPDTVTIAPNSYAIFPKSQTQIALNNFGDEIFLHDFEGNIVDRVTYEKSQKGFSYALIHLKRTADLVASTQIVRPRQHAESAWEWIDEPTPGRENPTFEKLSGVISRLLAGGDFGNTSFELTLPDGKPKTIQFAPDRLDPLMAEAVLREGTSVEIHAREKEGMYELEKIQKVYPAAEKTGEKKIPWLIIGFIGLGILLNAIPLIRALREYLKKEK